MLAHAQNKSMLHVNTTAARVHGFATWDPVSTGIELFIINKFEEAQNVTFVLRSIVQHSTAVGSDTSTSNGRQHAIAPVTRVDSVVDTADHWGTQLAGTVTCNAVGSCTVQLPAVSFSRIY